MDSLILQNYPKSELAGLSGFIHSYLEKIPDAKLNSPEFYTNHPALAGGENAFCVLDSGRRMVGFAPLFPVITTGAGSRTGPYDIWTIVLALPGYDAAEAVRALLFQAVLDRASTLKTSHGLPRLRLASDMMVSQQADIDFLLQKGFEPFEQIHVMRRNTYDALPAILPPVGISIRRSKLASAEEQAAYLRVQQACFPSMQKTEADLQFLLRSSMWKQGSVFMAISPANKLVGSILVYDQGPEGQAVLDDVMVLPDWRGRNIAKALIAEGVKYLQAWGILEIRLEVLASNQPALSVYSSMGFREVNREILLGLYI